MIRDRFTLERKVVNWDTEYLEGQIRSLAASTNYQGDLSITFPVTYSKVVVSVGNDPKSFMADIYKLIEKAVTATTRYGMVQSIWPYATSAPDSVDNGERVCAVQNERAWWRAWQMAIRNGILAKKIGHVTVEDRMEAAIGYRAPERKKGKFGVVDR